jgi:D-serine deaminase-like pyridoxal phosphate-dependent protein
VKAHKNPDLARRQLAAGAPGLCTATVWEAVVMAEAGMDDLFIVNTVVGQDRIDAVAALAREARIRVAVDDVTNALELSAAAVAAGSTIGVLLEVDTGMDRAGVDDAGGALALARDLVDLLGLRLDGLTGYEGHCARTPDDDLRLARQREAMAMFIEVADVLIAAGFPVEVLSAGGTGTWEWTASNPRITEVQAGTYAVIDTAHGRMSPGFEHSLTVESTVVSRTPRRLVVDAGNKSLAGGDLAIVVGHPNLEALRFDEEHGIFVVTGSCQLQVGDTVAVVPGSSPGTVNLYDAYHVVEDDVVVDIWPIVPRGPGHAGLLAR